ncbi:uncharacterized protein J3R85_008966 [Psidium guajava]|nr:uncharacterized protein J3R85_008966 [Psidium guajava]
MAEGYESFFSCTRTLDKGRTGYAGVATFCRVRSAFSSREVALPVAAEEGFTGLLRNSRKDENHARVAGGLEDFAKDDLLRVDSEGRCVITDHGHFVLFNIYGPRVHSDDAERTEFKLKFYKILQRRWEYLLQQGRRLFVVGDLNIAPAAIDRCEAGPDFEKDEFRKWLRSMLVGNGGPFFDIFRAKHPDRKDAYTCWPSNTGAEQFNFGSRIDHILCAGSCLHEDCDPQGHNLVACHVKDCDILTIYKRWKPGNAPRWNGGWSTKLEGSDHAPVYVCLEGIDDVSQHDTPSISARYFPTIRGIQQTIASVLMKRQVSEQVAVCGMSASCLEEDVTITSCIRGTTVSFGDCDPSASLPSKSCASSNQKSGSVNLEVPKQSHNFTAVCASDTADGNQYTEFKKKAKKGQGSQLSLRSFFQRSSDGCNKDEKSSGNFSLNAVHIQKSNDQTNCNFANDEDSRSLQQNDLNISASPLDQSPLGKGKNNVALLEWQRIQQLMQNSIPLCKGHGEPCVSRVVKKAGPNCGRRFYTCPRAEGPASNPEANCGFFKWASSKSKHCSLPGFCLNSFQLCTWFCIQKFEPRARVRTGSIMPSLSVVYTDEEDAIWELDVKHSAM